MTAEEPVVGVELGGTKSVAVLARGRTIIHRVTVPTREPNATLEALRSVLQTWRNDQAVAALGIGSFGPIRLNVSAPDYGQLLKTPKPGWSGVDVLESLSRDLCVPVAIDTDVNGAALAEWRWGARHLETLCYITVGTGVGVGVVHAGRPMHGALHPEAGHMRLRRALNDQFVGACPFHGDCVEGLISGPALQHRFGETLGDDDPRWKLVAHDLAQLVSALFLTLGTQRVLIGGGVGIANASLVNIVRNQVAHDLADYLPYLDKSSVNERILAPTFGADAGPLGAVALAYDARARADACNSGPMRTS
jgi:fructokinase